MSAVVFGAVLAAAILHASWNAIAKSIPDPRVSAGLFGAVGLAAGAVGVLLLPLPEPAAWPFIAGSSVLQTGYLLLLVRAYRHGEFGQVYPLARGLPPVLVTVVSLGWLRERLTAGQLAGVAVVSVALAGLVFARGDGRPRVGSGLWLAAATGVVIAGYTLVDGVGVRQAGQPLSYLAWLFLLHGALVLAVSAAVARRGFGRGFRLGFRNGFGRGFRGGFDRGFDRAVRRSAPLGLLDGALSAGRVRDRGVGAEPGAAAVGLGAAGDQPAVRRGDRHAGVPGTVPGGPAGRDRRRGRRHRAAPGKLSTTVPDRRTSGG